MKLLGLHSKAWKMWKHEDSLFAGHLWKKNKTKPPYRQGTGTQFQSLVIYILKSRLPF